MLEPTVWLRLVVAVAVDPGIALDAIYRVTPHPVGIPDRLDGYVRLDPAAHADVRAEPAALGEL